MKTGWWKPVAVSVQQTRTPFSRTLSSATRVATSDRCRSLPLPGMRAIPGIAIAIIPPLPVPRSSALLGFLLPARRARSQAAGGSCRDAQCQCRPSSISMEIPTVSTASRATHAPPPSAVQPFQRACDPVDIQAVPPRLDGKVSVHARGDASYRFSARARSIDDIERTSVDHRAPRSRSASAKPSSKAWPLRMLVACDCPAVR